MKNVLHFNIKNCNSSLTFLSNSIGKLTQEISERKIQLFKSWAVLANLKHKRNIL